jgi:hypothetical protein
VSSDRSGGNDSFGNDPHAAGAAEAAHDDITHGGDGAFELSKLVIGLWMTTSNESGS